MLALLRVANLVVSGVWVLLVAISDYLLFYKMNVHMPYNT